ncbi:MULTISPECIES: SCP2 sterol-binding domain-containing protein [Streptomyces]|uniref:SCP2 sterol-binding domain-containing protein n=1 Tax=Streptomyces TaxID=1883 RepID=UPI000CD4D868|nr:MULTISPECIES: SCP2 sterol-binding domain-containing protein [Streptomyces]
MTENPTGARETHGEGHDEGHGANDGVHEPAGGGSGLAAGGTPGADDLESLDFASVSPEEFATIVKGMSKREISELAADPPLRKRVLREIFSRMERQFRPEAAGSLSAVIRWEITGDTTETYDVTVHEGTCAVHEGASEASPRTTITLGDAEFLKLVSGNANPVTMFMTRKLRLGGDVALATGMTRLFNIPKPR